MSSPVDLALPYICDLQPYKPGMPIEALARQFSLQPADIIKLASNENPYGMSPKAAEAVRLALAGAHRYPDAYELRAALAKFYGLGQENVVLGNGSNDVLDLVARVFLAKDSESISSEHAFIVYRLVTQVTGAANVIIPAKDFGHDLAAMRAAITDKTKVVWIANPNNPTGTLIPNNEILDFLEPVPKEVVVVLDQAYYEYLNEDDHMDASDWLAKYPNLVITRTFSKAYGLAGLRIGYALASPEIADLLNRVRQPFNVSHVSLAAAVAALADQEFVHDSAERNRQGLAQLIKGFDDLNLPYIPAHGNFVTIQVGNLPEVQQQLLKQGVIVRPVGEYGLPEHLRISVGTKQENERFLDTLQTIIKEGDL